MIKRYFSAMLSLGESHSAEFVLVIQTSSANNSLLLAGFCSQFDDPVIPLQLIIESALSEVSSQRSLLVSSSSETNHVKQITFQSSYLALLERKDTIS